MAVNSNEASYPPPIPPSRRSGDQGRAGEDELESSGENIDVHVDQPTDQYGANGRNMDLDQIGELMAMNIGLETPAKDPDWLPNESQDWTPSPTPSPDSAAIGDVHPGRFQPAARVAEVPPGPNSPDPISPDPNAADPIIVDPISAAPVQGHPGTPEQIGLAPPVREAATTATLSSPPSLILNTAFQNPWSIVGAAVVVLALVASISWVFGLGDDQQSQGGSNVLTTPGADPDTGADISDNADSETDNQADGAVDGNQDSEDTNQQPLSPAAIPPTNQPGLVGLTLQLFDPYSGRGTTGSVELYLNAVTGQICHTFQGDVLTNPYRAYIHEATYPREGPTVVDLGETVGGVSQCAMGSPIELARIMTNADNFYVAAHSPDRDVLLRGQVSEANTEFDNRDEATVAEQAAIAQASQTTPTTEASEALFAGTGEGAYLIVDAGRVTFEGAVADNATASRLQSAFIPLAGLGVEVVDNLTVEAGAPPPSGRVVVADALLFDSGQDRIDGRPLVVTTLADLLRVNPTWTATITGHSDNLGEWLYNVDLSLRRANSIRTNLAELGVPPERIRVQGAGPEQPIADNQTPEGRARNRRIEINISSQ